MLNSNNLSHIITLPIPKSAPPERDLFLCPLELARLKKIKSESAKHIFKWSRFLLKKVLSSELQKPLTSITFNYSDYQKPYLKNSPIHFNLSHTESLISIGLSRTSSCGIDCEKPRTIKDIELLKKKVFSSAEIETLTHQPYFKSPFFLGWVVKESLAKMEGTSIFKAVNYYEIQTIFPTYVLSKNKKTKKIHTTFISTYINHCIAYSNEDNTHPKTTHMNSQNLKYTLK